MFTCSGACCGFVLFSFSSLHAPLLSFSAFLAACPYLRIFRIFRIFLGIAFFIPVSRRTAAAKATSCGACVAGVLRRSTLCLRPSRSQARSRSRLRRRGRYTESGRALFFPCAVGRAMPAGVESWRAVVCCAQNRFIAIIVPLPFIANPRQRTDENALCHGIRVGNTCGEER